MLSCTWGAERTRIVLVGIFISSSIIAADCVQATAVLHKGKDSGKHTPPDLEGQSEEGSLDKPKNSGEDFGVMSARAGSWIDMTQTNRYTLNTPDVPNCILLNSPNVL